MRRQMLIGAAAAALLVTLAVERALSSAARKEQRAPAPPAAATDADAAAPLQLAKPEALLERFPAIHVAARKPALEENGNYPCSECHDESLPNDARERELVEAHDDIALMHGAGRMWCTTCHHEDRGMLRSLKGEPIDFDQQFLLCGGCHFAEQRDFFYGAHGKRTGSWQGERHVVACTGCHGAHDPAIKPRLPWRKQHAEGSAAILKKKEEKRDAE